VIRVAVAKECVELAIGRNGVNQQPRRALLFNDGILLLHQDRTHNLVVVAAAAGDECDEGCLNGAQAGIKGGGFHVGTFKNIAMAVEKSHTRGGATVGCMRVVGGLQSRSLQLIIGQVLVVEGEGEGVVVGFQEKGSFKGEKVVGTEPLREQVREWPELCCGLRGYQDLDVGGGAEFLEELPAVPAGGGGDGKGNQVGLCIQGEVGDQELFGVDGVVEGEPRELQVHAHQDAAGGGQAHGGDGELGDGGAGQGLGGGDQGGEEFREGHGGGLRHGQGFRG